MMEIVKPPGRYSFHYHLAGDAPNAYVKNNAFYNSNWRWAAGS